MSVNSAIDFFMKNNQISIANKIKPLQDVGLGYIKLGQSSNTLSGWRSSKNKNRIISF